MGNRIHILICIAAFYITIAAARNAPMDLCYADPRDTSPQPIGHPNYKQVNINDPLPAPKWGYVEHSSGCELRLLDPRVDVSSRSPEKADATIAWTFDLGTCQIPIAYREYYNCTGNLIPSPETCEGYSATSIRFEGLTIYTLVNISLLLQPGIFDSGSFLYSFIYGQNRYNGRIIVHVEKNTDYPCKMYHGLMAPFDHHPQSHVETPNDKNHRRGRGCFPELVEPVLWVNISSDLIGGPPFDYNHEDEADIESDELPEEDIHNYSDCRATNMFVPREPLSQVLGSQSLLVGSLGFQIITQPWQLKQNESYDGLRNASLEPRHLDSNNDRDLLDETEMIGSIITTPPPTHPKGVNGGFLQDLPIIEPTTEPCLVHTKIIGIGTVVVVFLLFILISLCVYTCVLRSRIGMVDRAYVKQVRFNSNPSYQQLTRYPQP
ncbi:envelope glycoprotein G [Felid alphaherpesvirus 1]|nr:envelope glycoprotein G [Felid alphaherpesvirus 1]AVW81987.1 envelope glycoprotein G [Felid alphaherpesvirus 1]AVW82064.1 envelope glycoprotein G [Felid alphaherpesvirus 1]